MKTTPTAKPLAKARKMWTNNINWGVKQIFIHNTPDAFTDAFPVLVHRADRASLQAAVERARVAIGLGLCAEKQHWTKGKPYEQLARAAIEAAWGVKLK
jgi:hypothetical protein